MRTIHEDEKKSVIKEYFLGNKKALDRYTHYLGLFTSFIDDFTVDGKAMRITFGSAMAYEKQGKKVNYVGTGTVKTNETVKKTVEVKEEKPKETVEVKETKVEEPAKEEKVETTEVKEEETSKEEQKENVDKDEEKKDDKSDKYSKYKKSTKNK